MLLLLVVQYGFGVCEFQRQIRQPAPLPFDDLEFALPGFYQGRQALHPVTVVAVQHAVDVLDLRLVDMATDHAVEPALARRACHGIFERGHEVHRILGLVLQVLRQRPVTQTEASACAVEPVVQFQDQGVELVAQQREPFGLLHHRIVEVPVDYQQFAAVGGDVDRFVDNLDIAECEAQKLAEHFVVVAGDVGDAGAFARFAQHFLHDVVMRAGPVPAALELPAVDDVAYQVKPVGFVVAQEVEQIFGLAAGCSQVNIGNPDSAVPVHRQRRGKIAGIQSSGLTRTSVAP